MLCVSEIAVCLAQQALEILELQDQLQDSKDAVTEARTHAKGLQEQCRQLEVQVSSLQQQLENALRYWRLFHRIGRTLVLA